MMAISYWLESAGRHLSRHGAALWREVEAACAALVVAAIGPGFVNYFGGGPREIAAAYVCVGAALVPIALRMPGVHASTEPRMDAVDAFVYALTGLAMQAASVSVLAVLALCGLIKPETVGSGVVSGISWFTALTYIVIMPRAEELVFRRWLWSVHRYAPHFGVLAFAWAHYFTLGPIDAGVTLFVGAALAYIRHVTGGINAGTIVHASFNLCAIATSWALT